MTWGGFGAAVGIGAASGIAFAGADAATGGAIGRAISKPFSFLLDAPPGTGGAAKPSAMMDVPEPAPDPFPLPDDPIEIFQSPAPEAPPAAKAPAPPPIDSEARFQLQQQAYAACGGNTACAQQAYTAAAKEKLSEARAARDALSAKLAPLKGKAPATVTGGYNTSTGEVAARACGGGKCAEDHVFEALGGNKAETRFTEAVRPRTGAEVPVCPRCEGTYGRGAFPPGTKFKSD
jgi:hypothetical protein